MQAPTTEIAILAGGCFWGMEEILRKGPGVISTRVGYTGGSTPNPVYEQVKQGDTGHVESVEIVFDPNQLSYQIAARLPLPPGERQALLSDPTTAERLDRVGRLLRREIALLRRTRSIAVSPAILRISTGVN